MNPSEEPKAGLPQKDFIDLFGLRWSDVHLKKIERIKSSPKENSHSLDIGLNFEKQGGPENLHNLICEACFHKSFTRSMRLSAWESIIYFDKSTISRKIYAGALVVWAELLGHPSWGGWVIKLAFLPAYAECRHGTLLCWKAVLEPEIASDRTMTGRLQIRVLSAGSALLSSLVGRVPVTAVGTRPDPPGSSLQSEARGG